MIITGVNKLRYCKITALMWTISYKPDESAPPRPWRLIQYPEPDVRLEIQQLRDRVG